MMYPLVRELATTDGTVRVPVAVTCRILKIARQPFYRWLAKPITEVEWGEALIANAAFDAHQDDPEFGYRFIADEVRDAGINLNWATSWYRETGEHSVGEIATAFSKLVIDSVDWRGILGIRV